MTDVIITFVNGIYHSEQDVANITNYLKDAFNFDVRSFYNPSSGSWVMDAYNAGYGLVLRPSDLVLAKQLASHLRNALNDVRPDGGRVLHIAHSGGAILTYLAAKYHLTSSETNRIDVITLGGGRSLTHKYFRGRVYNYYARNDPVLLVDNRASRLLRKATNATYALVRDAKHNTTFVYLEALARDPIFDHAMEGPTYRKALQWEALQLRERVQHRRQREAREKDIIRRIRKRTARYTGLHHFWGGKELRNGERGLNGTSIRLSGRMVRKYAAQYTGMRGVISGKYRRQSLGVNPLVMMDSNTNRTDLLLGTNETALPQLGANASTTARSANTTVSTSPASRTTPSWRLSYAVATVTDMCRMMRKYGATATGMRGAFSRKYSSGTVQQSPVSGKDGALENELLQTTIDTRVANMSTIGNGTTGGIHAEALIAPQAMKTSAVELRTDGPDPASSDQMNDKHLDCIEQAPAAVARQQPWSALRALDDLFAPLVWGRTPHKTAFPLTSANTAPLPSSIASTGLVLSVDDPSPDVGSSPARLLEGDNSSTPVHSESAANVTTEKSEPPAAHFGGVHTQ